MKNTSKTTRNVRITVEQYDRLEWAVEVDGHLWAAGDCESVADGECKARAELAKAGIVQLDYQVRP